MNTALLAGAWLAAMTTMVAAQAPAGKATHKGGPGRFTLTSPDISEGKTIPEKHIFDGFGCKGGNVSPALSWSNAPAGTKSFALLMHDPDAPTGSGWWHWIVYNIPAGTTSLPAGAGDPQKDLMPPGVIQGRTDFGTPGYGGPCPPPGKPHRYYLRLYALKVAKLDAPADATAAFIGFNVHAQELGRAELMGVYGR
jgi:Raf kinase inhibitor-like YbhB/YbcL family protein